MFRDFREFRKASEISEISIEKVGLPEGPPQLPQAALSTIAPASPSVAAFNVASQSETARSPVRPLTSSSLSISQQLMMAALASDSGRVATFRADS